MRMCVFQGNLEGESVVAAILPSLGGKLLYLRILFLAKPAKQFQKSVCCFSRVDLHHAHI